MTLFVMFEMGYVLTTLVLRSVWRNPTRLWLYSLVSAALIITHLQVFYSQIHTGWDLSMRQPVQSGAGCAAFACTFAGGWVLRRWIDAGNLTAETCALRQTISRRHDIHFAPRIS